MNDNIFRILAALILFTGMGISSYYRRKADRDTGEKISRKAPTGPEQKSPDLILQHSH